MAHDRFMVRMREMDIASLTEPWAELMRQDVPGMELFDAHTHLGQNDPDGMSQTPEELLATLARPAPAGRSCSRCTSPTATRRPTTWCSKRQRDPTGC